MISAVEATERVAELSSTVTRANCTCTMLCGAEDMDVAAAPVAGVDVWLVSRFGSPPDEFTVLLMKL